MRLGCFLLKTFVVFFFSPTRGSRAVQRYQEKKPKHSNTPDLTRKLNVNEKRELRETIRAAEWDLLSSNH
jgi:hypothetical protein